MLIISAKEFHRVLTSKTRLRPSSASIFSIIWFNELNIISKFRIHSTALVPIVSFKIKDNFQIILEISTEARARRALDPSPSPSILLKARRARARTETLLIVMNSLNIIYIIILQFLLLSLYLVSAIGR
jgi:hypothetical protein